MQQEDQLVLVNENDQPVGVMGKLKTHELGLLHRAFSAFIFRRVNGRSQLLLQKRATTKYHFGGLWTNACCGHPLEGETPVQAGMRRLPQEMNFDCELRSTSHFIYRAQSENGLFEHELDHVLVGVYESEPPAPNPAEADDARWIDLDELDRELAANPQKFTPWFAPAYAVARQFNPTKGA